MEGISPFQSGRPLLSEITADKLNKILAEIKRNRVVVAPPLSARQQGDGTHLSIKIPPGSSTLATPQPWDLIARVDPDADPEDENPDYLVTVRPGTLSNFLATNYNEEFTIAKNQTRYAIAEIATDQKSITGVTIKFEADPPDGQEPQLFALPDPVKVVFGVFSEGNVLRTIPAGNIQLMPRIWFQEARTNALPGESLYNLYYVLAP